MLGSPHVARVRGGASSDGTSDGGPRGEVLLAAGAIGSPQVLQLSGVGPRRVLDAAGAAHSIAYGPIVPMLLCVAMLCYDAVLRYAMLC